MRKPSFFLILFGVLSAVPGFAQTARTATTLQLTVDQAVRMALDHNVDLAVDRLDPQISDTLIAAALGSFKPVFTSTLQRDSELQPPTSFLIPAPTSTAIITSDVGFSQRLRRFGTTYGVAWDTSHTSSDSVLSSYNPLVRSGLSLNLSQPFLRDFGTDNFRTQVSLSQTNRAIVDTQLRESIVHITANVETEYWNLVSALATVEAQKSALQLAEELARVNKVKVDVGQSPPLDMVSALAEVAADQEQLIIAETTVKQTEDRLRVLIFDPGQRDSWNVKIEPIDAPPSDTVAIDLDGALARALQDRADLIRVRKDVDTASMNMRLASNQRLPDVRVNASYVASGLGGTQVLRTGGFPGTVVGAGAVTGFAGVLGQLFTSDFPTWTVGVSVSYPIGHSVEEATYARTSLERTQAEGRVRSAEAQAILQVRNAAWNIEMGAKRIETTRAARDLADQRLDAERKRFEVGLSTSFLVIQAQRDLAQAKTNEVAAVLSYDLSLVDFEVLQQAGPSTGQPTTTTPAAPIISLQPSQVVPTSTRTGIGTNF